MDRKSNRLHRIFSSPLGPVKFRRKPGLSRVGGFSYLTPANPDLIEIVLDEGEIKQTIVLTAIPERMTLFRHPAGLVDDGDH